MAKEAPRLLAAVSTTFFSSASSSVLSVTPGGFIIDCARKVCISVVAISATGISKTTTSALAKAASKAGVRQSSPRGSRWIDPNSVTVPPPGFSIVHIAGEAVLSLSGAGMTVGCGGTGMTTGSSARTAGAARRAARPKAAAASFRPGFRPGFRRWNMNSSSCGRGRVAGQARASAPASSMSDSSAPGSSGSVQASRATGITNPAKEAASTSAPLIARDSGRKTAA